MWSGAPRDEAHRRGIRARVSSWRRIPSDALIPHAKASGQYLNSVLAWTEPEGGLRRVDPPRHEGRRARARGERVRGSKEGSIATPPQSADILDGITRKSVMQIARDLGYEVQERDVARAELVLADEVFPTGTAAELTPVREIDDHPLGEPGLVTWAIQEVFHDALRGRSTATAIGSTSCPSLPRPEPAVVGARPSHDTTLRDGRGRGHVALRPREGAWAHALDSLEVGMIEAASPPPTRRRRLRPPLA